MENGEKAQLSASLLLSEAPPLPAGCQAFGFGEEGIEERTRQHGEEDGPWSVDAVWACFCCVSLESHSPSLSLRSGTLCLPLSGISSAPPAQPGTPTAQRGRLRGLREG